MLPIWFYIGIVAVFLWVAGSFFDKYLLERYFPENQGGGPGALLIFSSFFTSIVVLLILLFRYSYISFDLKPGMSGILVGAISGLWILSYLYALNRAEVSRVVPIFQTVPVFGLALGFLFLGERLSIEQIIAASGIIFGALILLHDRHASYLGIDLRTLVLMLIASFILAFTETSFKFLALGSSYWTTAFWTSTGFTLFGILLYFTVRKFRDEFVEMLGARLKHVMQANSMNEILDNSAELIFYGAVIIGPIALVQSLNAYQPLLALIAGILLTSIAPKYFSEDLTRTTLLQKLFGILIITGASIYLYTLI